ncbi:MAG TPA: hypothetical protein VF807_10025 [Ktedonobacterales bacterium]
MADYSLISSDLKARMRVPYALRGVPDASLASIVPLTRPYAQGDIVLTQVEKIGKNTGLELTTGRRSTLHVGDQIAVVFGNRYATRQFEGYARADGEVCDMLSMGGLCGSVESKHATLADPTKLQLLGAIGDAEGRPLRLNDFARPALPVAQRPRTIVVCGTSMDAGKTYTTMSLIRGLGRDGTPVAGIKLTGTAAGRDLWTMIDAGACIGMDFVDGGWPSTYMCELDDLLTLHNLLLSHAAAAGATWAVIEVADGLLQRETAALLQSAAFTQTVDAWVLAAGEPMAASAGVVLLRSWNIEPLAISGVVSMSQLGIQETTTATGIVCHTARDLQTGALQVGNDKSAIVETAGEPETAPHRPGEPEAIA